MIPIWFTTQINISEFNSNDVCWFRPILHIYFIFENMPFKVLQYIVWLLLYMVYYCLFWICSVFSFNRTETVINRPSYKSTMRLTISNVLHHDYGMYKCVAKNPRGETDGTIRLYCKYSKYDIQHFLIHLCIFIVEMT